MTPSDESYAVRNKANVVSRGKRELAIELRNHPIQVLALLRDGISYTEDRVSVSEQPAWRSRRTHASVTALCARTGRAWEVPAGIAGRLGKVCGRRPNANTPGKSDIGIVPSIRSNKAVQPAAESWGGKAID